MKTMTKLGFSVIRFMATAVFNNVIAAENALAERVNGILKAEFDLYSSSLRFRETEKSA